LTAEESIKKDTKSVCIVKPHFFTRGANAFMQKDNFKHMDRSNGIVAQYWPKSATNNNESIVVCAFEIHVGDRERLQARKARSSVDSEQTEDGRRCCATGWMIMVAFRSRCDDSG